MLGYQDNVGEQTRTLEPGNFVLARRGVEMGQPTLDYFQQSEKHDDSDSGDSTDGDSDEDQSVGEVDENPVMYCQLARPAFYRGEPQGFMTGEVPVAAGVCLRAYYRCPADIRGDRMTSLIRYPELIRVNREEVLPATELLGSVCRVVDVTDYGDLVVAGKHPCMPAMEPNDVWCRWAVSTWSEDIHSPTPMCVQGKCKMAGVWNPNVRGQIRWCARCCKWMHVRCLEPLQLERLDCVAASLDSWGQAYLLPIVNGKNCREKLVPIAGVKYGSSVEVDEDIHDQAQQIPTIAPSWREVACLPIRRRTAVGNAPETNEVLIQLARLRVEEGGNGADEPMDAIDVWFLDRCPQASLRAAKWILYKDIMMERSMVGIRRFVCLSCRAQVV